ncbi:MAG TPA: hypothetical protein VM846_03130, partial [Vicinamibacterales bacterium]|nr:hypothetical protein [Vicinamibacterales bacterium]
MDESAVAGVFSACRSIHQQRRRSFQHAARFNGSACGHSHCFSGGPSRLNVSRVLRRDDTFAMKSVTKGIGFDSSNDSPKESISAAG